MKKYTFSSWFPDDIKEKEIIQWKIWDKVIIELQWYSKPYRIWIVQYMSHYAEWLMLSIWDALFYDTSCRKPTEEELELYFNNN